METKLVRVPFDLELAKQITDKSVEGRIVTRCGFTARVICWDRFGSGNPLVVLFNNGKDEVVICYNNDGVFSTVKKEDGLDLMLEIPEYMTFKDGDVLYVKVNDGNQYIFIYLNNGKDKTFVYAALDDIGTLFIEKNRITDNDDISELRFATEKEKQKLIDALKVSKKPKAKNYLELFFGIEQKQEYEFKPFDKVLVRDSDDKRWIPNFFWGKGDMMFRTIGGTFWNQCIPYNDQTAHLLGTTEDYNG